MTELFNPDKHDLIRETIMILVGLFARWYELRKIKKQNNDKF
jgi:predicted site-specific integrase-resolvase